MKCGICHKRFNSIGAMGKHYRKKHPKIMKHHRKYMSTKYPQYHGVKGQGKWVREFADLIKEYGGDIVKWSKR